MTSLRTESAVALLGFELPYAQLSPNLAQRLLSSPHNNPSIVACAFTRIRTGSLQIRNLILYPLSYKGFPLSGADYLLVAACQRAFFSLAGEKNDQSTMDKTACAMMCGSVSLANEMTRMRLFFLATS